MENESDGKLFTSALKRVVRSVSTPGEAEAMIQDRLAKLGMTFQEYVTSLIAFDCWAEKPHALTGDAAKGHRRGKESREQEMRLWRELIRDYGKPNKTGSFFAHALGRAVAKIVDPGTEA